MTETVEREAPELPLHMRRDGFDPVPEMAALRDDEGVRQVETAFGVPAFLSPGTRTSGPSSPTTPGSATSAAAPSTPPAPRS